MGYHDPDPYYQPEKFGLTIIEEINWSDEPYQFDLTVIWQRESDGAYFVASDNGCSCPSPFEDINTIDDLTLVTDGDALHRELVDLLYDRSEDDGDRLENLVRISGLAFRITRDLNRKKQEATQ